MALFAAGSIRLLPAFYRVVSLSHSLSNYAPDLGKILDVLDVAIEDQEIPLIKDITGSPFKDNLRFNDVSFSYPTQGHGAITNLNLTLYSGDRVMITGPSGSGKSTFLALSLGLLKPDDGFVSFDDKNVDVLNVARGASVALVPQDAFILTGSVADNICFPKPASSINVPLAQKLLKAVGLDWDMDRHVGENGMQLSGGERQRLALVRALYLSPSFLILDESTSQLDVDMTKQVYELVYEICPTATILISTHQDLGTEHCNRYLLFENGKLTEIDHFERTQ